MERILIKLGRICQNGSTHTTAQLTIQYVIGLTLALRDY